MLGTVLSALVYLHVFNPHNNPIRLTPLLSEFYREEKWGLNKLKNNLNQELKYA